MNLMRKLYFVLARRYQRWRNRRARARRYVKTWPETNRRDTVAYFRGAVRRG